MRRYFTGLKQYVLPVTGALTVGVYLRWKGKRQNVYASSEQELPSSESERITSPPSADDLVVRNVQIFVRHGARTPLKVLPYLDQVFHYNDGTPAE